MQPLNTRLNPSWESTIGCDPSTLRSMIDSRLCPKATGPRHQTPQPSGPRGDMTALIRSTAVMSAYSPSNLSSPTKPHISVLSDDPGVLGPATAGGVDHQTALRCDPGQREVGQSRVLRLGAAKVDESPEIHVPGLQRRAAQGGMGGEGHHLLGDPGRWVCR